MKTTSVVSVAAAAALVIVAAAVTAQPRAEPPVVSVAWLAAHLRDPDLVLLHVGERAQYDREHIPGSRFVHPRDLSVQRDGLVLEVPPAERLRATLEALGIGDRSRVIVYFGEDWFSPATRVLFTLDVAGLGERSALLDGGMPAWKRAGQPVTAAPAIARRGRLTPHALRPLVVDATWVRARTRTRGVAIVDARAPVFYDGPRHGEHRAGHIPGATNIPFSTVADDSLMLLPQRRLAALFAAAGVQRGDTVVAYCHIGQQATAVLFAARVLGYPVRLFDGSFEDWSRRAELPVEGGGTRTGGSTRRPE